MAVLSVLSMSVFVVYSCFLPLCVRVCVVSGVWWCCTCCVKKVVGGAECVCALAQHTFWWMLPLYGISVMFRQCDIAECVSGWSRDGKLKAKALCSGKVTRLLHTCSCLVHRAFHINALLIRAFITEVLQSESMLFINSVLFSLLLQPPISDGYWPELACRSWWWFWYIYTLLPQLSIWLVWWVCMMGKIFLHPDLIVGS